MPTLADYPHLHTGKVRDLYAVDDELLLVVASDRISAYDWVLPTPITDKGRILTAMSAWWFDRLAAIVHSHLVAVDDPRIPAEVRGRAMLVRRLAMFPIECVARGYLAGSGLVDYAESGAVCGVPLPAGLVDGSRLPEPIFTPATKAAVGEHDENVGLDRVVDAVGAGTATRLRELTLAVYGTARDLAADRGILLADTKLEFGLDRSGTVVLGDEVLTPDSSRFWPADQWRPGRSQPSYDKQYVRDWLVRDSGWDRVSAPPPLPAHVVEATRSRYVEAYELLTGLSFTRWPD
ncbi:MAG: phosphoribosylaminoimidazolesuccinocarboxamide synthase [Actinobacteria bacterium]|nr:phosphoribosylaminoimidazolesuccinocarboxamide synthase [Actinomycetota bacterium]MBI3686447.1 phosphoribosylaminoimidazolesuccinocarboxamide synthase [Actinomycetota bacterium]